ncbi:hypothetical protein G6F65_018895 [Rhizopus arrhizus]|nr:hypothetical protein G6F65_018895 [Rhizopus arrhizus]
MGQCRPRHGRLLGGQREVCEVDHEEAAGVVQRGQQAFDELVQVQRDDEEFQVDGEHHDEAATQRRLEHRQVFRGVARDVGCAGFGGACHPPARQLRERRGRQVPDAAAGLGGADEFGRQVHVLVALRGVHPDAQQQFDAVQAQLHASS